MIRTRFWWVFLGIVTCAACHPNESDPPKLSAAKTEIDRVTVQAYTGGAIARDTRLRVLFQERAVSEGEIGKVVSPSPFSIQPALKGVSVWSARNEIEFRPTEELNEGTRYKTRIDLSRIFSKNTEKLETTFWLRPQTFEVTWRGLQSVDKNTQRYQGAITTGDPASGEAVEQMVTAKQGGSVRRIRWDHESDGLTHRFAVEKIRRHATDSELFIKISGKPIGVERQEDRKVAVLAQSAFAVLSADGGQRGSHVEFRFSDALKTPQKLAGLITVAPKVKLRFETQGSVVRVFSTGRWPDRATFQVRKGIRNSDNKRLKKARKFDITFARLKPAVRFAGKGVIIPATKDAIVPVETANLTHIRVEAMRVPARNVGQFLQINALDEGRELKRVGRVVWSRRIDLDASESDRERWVRRGLDLSTLVEQDPRGFYYLRLNFEPNDVVYNCPAGTIDAYQEPPPTEAHEWFETSESSSWDSFEAANTSGWPYWESHSSNSYQHAENPCHPAYYRDSHTQATRNVLFSTIGLVAKVGQTQEVFAAATDLRTATPLSGAEVEVLDYQLEVVGSNKTDAQGLVRIDAARRPFAVFVRQNEQVGMVRFHDGESLSVAHFDTRGAAVQKGLKGYFYGERGVWRPGDDIYLTFVVFDASGQLPARHPATFQLRDPQGRRVDSQTHTHPTDGFYVFKTGTQPRAPTGDYVAEVRLGGARFTHLLSVESVVPNRLKIDLDFGAEQLQGPVAKINAPLHAEWLHGAQAKDLRVEVRATLSPKRTRFAKFGDFYFDDPTRKFGADSRVIFEGRLNHSGDAQVTGVLESNDQAPGMLSARFENRVYEEYGGSSVDSVAIDFSPYPRYIGVKTPKGDKARGMLLTDTEHTAEIVAVDPHGEPVNSTVDVKLFKIQWRWWWEASAENFPDYAGSSSYRPIATGKVNLRNGRGKWKFQTRYPDWGRYLLTVTDPDGGHRTGKILYMDWPGWAGRGERENPGGAHVLSIGADAARYSVGATATLTFPSTSNGRALVSLENGSRVLDARWVETQDKMTQHTFTVTPEMAPGIYAHVHFLQPYEGKKNDFPMRLYGVVPLEVMDDSTILAPLIESVDEFEPNSEQTVWVREKDGRPMSYTVAVVDEGLLGLTRFRTPNPWEAFYRRESLGVKTWDVYSQVAGAYGGELESVLAIGGGESEEGAGNNGDANRFPAMVRFYGPFRLEAGAKRSHKVDIPAYLGAVRVMVVAGDGRSFGHASKTVRVTRPLMFLASLPRVLGPGEELDLPVSIFVTDEKIRKVQVSLKATGPIKSGAATSALSFSGAGDKTLSFPLSVKQQIGIAKLTLSAQGGGQKLEQTIEINVRHPNPPVTQFLSRKISPGQTLKETLRLPGITGTNSVQVELSPRRPLNISRGLDYLVNYPHGCVEQTTSTAFPQVYLSQLVDLDSNAESQVKYHVSQAIEKLQRFQNAQGGFSYWPGARNTNDWTTTWVGHFLLEAKRAGFSVPDSVLAQWKNHQREQASRWALSSGRRNSALAQSYRLYTLALAGSPELAAMNRLRERGDDALDSASRARLAAAYALTGQQDVAKTLMVKTDLSFDNYQDIDETFGSLLRDKAFALEAMVALKREADIAQLTSEVSAALDGESQHHTHAIAMALVALARATLVAGTSQPIEATLDWNGNTSPLNSSKPLVRKELRVVGTTNGPLEIANRGPQPLFARFVLRGAPPVGQETQKTSGLRVSVQYQAATGGQTVMQDGTLSQGSDFLARVTIAPAERKSVQRVAVTQIIASGFEIRDDRSTAIRGIPSVEPIDYQDIQDDRILTYIDRLKEPVTFEVRMHAAYAGKYYLPPVRAEAMYDDRTSGHTKGRWVSINRPGPEG